MSYRSDLLLHVPVGAGGTTVNAGLATETDSALAVTILKVYPVSVAT